MSNWTNLVKKIYAGNKHKPGYKLGHAMKDAKKIYRNTAKAPKGKKGKTMKKKGGITLAPKPYIQGVVNE